MTDTATRSTAHHVPADLPDPHPALHRRRVRRLASTATRSTCSTRSRTRPTCRPRPARRPTSTAPSPPRARAFTEGPWPRMLPRERSRVLHRIADIVESRDARLAELESFDSGLPITQALGQARRAAENFRFFADLIVAQADDAYKVPGRQLNYVNRKPIGVAGLITPWNTPFMLESWKLGPALATGNTVVLKPAEFTPLSASLWAGHLRGGRAAEGRLQPRQRTRRGGRRRAGEASRRPAHLVHRREPHRPAHLRQRRAVPQGPVDGARRQVARRSSSPTPTSRPRSTRRSSASSRSTASAAPPGSRILVAARRSTTSSSSATPRRRRASWSATRTTRRPRSARSCTPSTTTRSCRYVEIGKTEGRLVAGGGRPDGFADRQLRRPDGVRRRRRPTPGSSRRRSSARSSRSRRSTPTRRRSRSRTASKYGLAAYVWTNDLQARAQLRAGGRGRHGLAQLATTCATCAPRSAASRPPASATRAATARSTSTPTSRPCTSRSARPTTPPSASRARLT